MTPGEFAVLRILAFASLLLASSAFAAVASYTDVWFDPDEPGWGVFVVQSNTFQFISFFIYGADGKPTWYTAQLTDDGTGNYSGLLYATTGTNFEAAWIQNRFTINAVGGVTWQPTDIYHAQLGYALVGDRVVNKSVQRQTLTPLALSGSYSGSITGAVASCTNAANNNPSFHGRFNLTVTQNANTSAGLTFSFVDNTYNGLVCTWNGPITQYGLLYQMSPGQYTCSAQGFNPAGTVTTATVESFHTTGQGIEGRWVVSNAVGCVETVHFTAVLN
jgi:hypothetical protein